VIHFRTLWRLALLALLLSVCSPEARASWQCEGRTCGTSLWFCCCVSPVNAQDSNCPTAVRTASTRNAQVCPSECQCVLTVSAVDTEVASTSPLAVAPHYCPALATRRVAFVVPVPTGGTIRSVEGRGPPPRPIVFASPSLRAPPVA
jgi:hypothetical protein